MTDSTTSKDAVVIERTFDAPTDLIWQMWTKPEHLKNWYGPQGFSIPIAEMDVRVGGKRLICMEMKTPDRIMKIWTTGEFTELTPHTRLAYTDSPSDEHGNLVIMDGDESPLITVVTVVLEDLDGRTKMVTTHAGLPANDQGASEGWKQAVTKLADYLETLTSND
ncbi:MAG: SRPBCC domain-containing protein [Aggregatilineales bacterium]